MTRMLATLALLLPWIAGPAQAQDKVVFAFGSEGFLFLPYYVAAGKGFFEKEGIKAEMVALKGGPLAMTAVLSGDADVLGSGFALNIQTQLKGQNVKAFAALVTEVATQLVIQGDIAAKAGIKESTPFAERLKVIKGLRIGITGSGSSTDRFLRSLIQAAGLKADSEVTIVPVGAGAPILASFAQKRIDVFFLSSPTAEQAKVEMGGVALVDLGKGEFAPLRGYLYNCLSARADWLEKNGDKARRIVRAIAAAERLIKEHPDEARAAAKPFLGKIDERVYNAAFQANLASYPATPRIEPVGVERNFVFIAETEGARPNVRPEDLYTNAYLPN